MCWYILISPGSECPERILSGERRDLLADHVRPILQSEGKVKEREAEHAQARDSFWEWKWVVCWGTFPHPKSRV